MEKMSGKTMNIVEDNIQKLKAIFPDIFNEDKVDFEKLERVLGNYKDDGVERYDFTWPGKGQARRIAQTPSTGTLRPCKEESKNWDTTENLYIEGDNLEVLKLLQKSYYEKVKMIYIDPPYNTGNDFVYKDDFKDNVENYLKVTGQKDAEGTKTTTNTESNGRYHSNWLNMMYPRLKLARNLLKEDGVIFISIDDNEVSNLKKMCDEVFGEENFVAKLPTVMNMKGNNDQHGFAGTHEYTIVYIKKIENLINLNGIRLTEDDKNEYTLCDNKGLYKKGATLMRTGEAGVREKRPKGYYPIYVSEDLKRINIEKRFETDIEVYPKTKDGKEMSWRRSKETLMNSLDEFIITKTKDGISLNKKQYLKEDMVRGKKAKTLFYKPEYSSGNGMAIIKKIFGGRVFDTPKPVELIKDFCMIGSNNDIILDFFSGAGTVSHAIMELNKEQNIRKRYILVQVPEIIDAKHEAYKAGYKNICEIGKERIRRAGEKIKEENKGKESIEDLDIGFKVFKLDSSNINKWDANYSESLEDSLLFNVDNIKSGREEEDILYEVLLKYGIDLNAPINEHNILGKKVYDIAEEIVLCLEDDITLEHIEAIGKLKESFDVENCRVVFMDSGFRDDVVKTNAIQVLKRYGIEDVKTI